eukprot:12614712-Ditylum_brightwellii.AAC.1
MSLSTLRGNFKLQDAEWGKSSEEEEEDDEKKKKKDKGQSPASAATPAGLTKDTYSSSMRKFMCYYFINHQYAARTQKHYLQNYLWNPKELGIWHLVAWLQEINSMLPYFPPPSNSKLLENKLVEIVLLLIPADWKCTMTCANFKGLAT